METRPRVCLDLNVFVAAEIAVAKGRRDTTPIRLIDACRRGEFELVISRSMLDRLVEVLRRPPLRLTLHTATERAETIAELAALPNLIVTGGGVMPLRDTEDRGVLEAALAGRAHFLATYNLAHFAAGAALGEGRLQVRDLVILHPADLAAELGLR
ncbi:MAG TPA: PIN domain-containing protein [Longimicrobiaceae bacterium]|nr:PIN domain-containing protein [Longimicrobiaceae bacterium]